MGTTRYYCRYIKVLLIPYQGAITIGGIDLSNMKIMEKNMETVIVRV